MTAPTPTVALVSEPWGVSVAVANPAPGTGEVNTASNRIERREGTSGSWEPVGTTGANTTWRDYTVASTRDYSYRAVALDADGTGSPSAATAAMAVYLVGSWLHRPSQGGGAGQWYPFLTDSRKESLEVEATTQRYVGRARPVVEYGDSELGALELAVLVPFGPDHAAGVAWLFTAVRARDVVLYRDNRGRFLYSAITSLSVEDVTQGTKLGFSLTPLDYTPEVI